MKKIYVKPVIEIEVTEESTLMAGSGNALSSYGNEVTDQPIDAVDGDESDAKGSFAFSGFDNSWEEEMW